MDNLTKKRGGCREGAGRKSKIRWSHHSKAYFCFVNAGARHHIVLFAPTIFCFTVKHGKIRAQNNTKQNHTRKHQIARYGFASNKKRRFMRHCNPNVITKSWKHSYSSPCSPCPQQKPSTCRPRLKTSLLPSCRSKRQNQTLLKKKRSNLPPRRRLKKLSCFLDDVSIYGNAI